MAEVSTKSFNSAFGVMGLIPTPKLRRWVSQVRDRPPSYSHEYTLSLKDDYLAPDSFLPSSSL